jgi:hypothetical protein
MGRSLSYCAVRGGVCLNQRCLKGKQGLVLLAGALGTDLRLYPLQGRHRLPEFERRWLLIFQLRSHGPENLCDEPTVSR